MEKREKKILNIVQNLLVERAEIKIFPFDEGCVAALVEKPNVIVTFPIRDEQTAVRMAMIKHTICCKLITLETEGLMDFENESILKIRIGQNKYPPNLVDCYFVWGPRPMKLYYNRLVETNKISNKDRMKYCGYVLYDKDIVQQQENIRARGNYYCKLTEQYERSILFATGFIAAAIDYNELIETSALIKDDNGKVDEKQYQDFLCKHENNKKFRDCYIDTICKYAKKYPEHLVLVKPHPIELEDQLVNIDIYRKSFEIYHNIIFIENDEAMGALLPNVDMLVHYGSTTGLESYIYSKPSLGVYYKTVDEGNISLYPSTYLVEISNQDDIMEILQKGVFQKNESTEKFLFENFGVDLNKEVHPIDNLLNEIMDGNTVQKIRKMEIQDMLGSEYCRAFKKNLFMKGLKKMMQGSLKAGTCLIFACLRNI